MKLILKLTLLCLVLVATSCKTYKPPKVYEIEKTFNSNYSNKQIWDKLTVYFSDNNYEIIQYDKSGGFLNAEKIFQYSDKLDSLADCGTLATGSFKTTYKEKIKLIINDSKVTMNINYVLDGGLVGAYGVETPQQWTCNSKGVKEAELKAMLIGTGGLAK